jgi:serine phosphatase RsbU (regulator of sigma subunit)
MKSLMLGMNEAAQFGQAEFQLDSREFLLLTSDGMVESPCRDGTQFGIPGITRFFEGYSGSAPLADLLAEVRITSSSTRLEDDVSAVLIAPA